MNKKFSIALAIATGIISALVTRYITPPPTFAQSQAPIAKEIRARSFTFVDESDRMVATLTVDPRVTPPRIVFRDADGHEIWGAGGRILRHLAEK